MGDDFPTVGTMQGRVILLKAARIIGDKNDKYLKTSTSGDYEIDPDMDAWAELKTLYTGSKYFTPGVVNPRNRFINGDKKVKNKCTYICT